MQSVCRPALVVVLLSLLMVASVEAQPGWVGISTGNDQVEGVFQAMAGSQSETALAKLQELAADGDEDAVFVMARAYATGQGVTASAEKFRQLLEQGVEGGHAESILAQATIFEAGQNEGDALYYYSRAAELGQPLAELRLGRCNENAELGLKRNPAMAATFYRRAHESGLSRATFELGRCYLDGIGVSTDALVSTKLIRQAAEARIPDACRMLAEAYADGRGIERDNVAAVGWLMYASQLGDRNAFVLLGRRFETGDGVVKNLNSAGQYYSAAAKNGDQVAKYRLAMLYIEGRGTQPDPIRGYVLLDSIRGLPPADLAMKQLEDSFSQEQLATAKKRSAQQRENDSNR